MRVDNIKLTEYEEKINIKKVGRVTRNRTKAALQNIVAGVINQLINVICNMILPPLIIASFGSAANGLIAAIKQLLNYAQLFGAGISTASMQALYKPLVDNDKKKINEMIAGISLTFIKAGWYFSVTTLIIACIYPWFVSDQPKGIIFSLTLLLGVAGVSEFFYVGKFKTLLGADQRSYIISIVQSVGAILNTLVSVLLLFATHNIIIVQLGGTIAYIVRIIIIFVYVKQRYPYITPKTVPDTSALTKRKDAVVHNLMGTIILNSQAIILSFTSLVQASVYSVYNLVFYGLYSIISSLVNSLTASIGTLMITETHEKLKEFYKLYKYIYYQLITIIYTTTAIILMSFIKLYTHKAQDANYTDNKVAILFIVIAIFNTIRIPAITLINAAGHFKETKRGAIVEAVLCVGTQIVLTKTLGLYGVLLGTLVALVFRSNELIIYVCRHIVKISPIGTYGSIFYNLGIGVTLYYLFHRFFVISINSWINWLFLAITVTLLISMIIILLNIFLDRKLAKQMLSYMYRMIKH